MAQPAALRRYWAAKRKTKNKRKGGFMARRYFAKRVHHKKSITIPVSLIAGFAPLAIGTYNYTVKDGPSAGAWYATQALTGYDTRAGAFWAPNLKKGLLPIFMGTLIHKFVGGSLGVNRMLSSAGIPLLRV